MTPQDFFVEMASPTRLSATIPSSCDPVLFCSVLFCSVLILFCGAGGSSWPAV